MPTAEERIMDGALTEHIPFLELIDILKSNIRGQVFVIMITDQVSQNETDPATSAPFTRYHAKGSAEYTPNIDDVAHYMQMNLASLKRDVLIIAQAVRSSNIDTNIITLCVRYTCLLSMNLLNIGLSQSELVILREYAPIDFPQKLKDTYNEYYTVLIALFLVLARYGYIQNDDELRIHLVTELTGIMKQIEEQLGTSREVISEALKLID